MDYTGRIITKNPQTPSANGAPGVWTLDEAMQYTKQGKWPPGYQISRSVRLRSSASAYFNRTPASAGNRRTWTWSGWVKLGSLSTTLNILYAYSADSDSGLCQLSYQSNQLRIQGYSASFLMISTPVYRDPSAWYHIVYKVDTTQATAADRVRVYVNGVEITAWATNTPPPQNTDTAVNNNVAHNIGRNTRNSNDYLDGYFAEVNLIDGQALPPTSFGYFDTYTGVWQPAPYTGTYGTNGFYLNFKDPTSTTTIGYDYSGNSNNWTANNISVTAGTTYDSMVDVPINWGTDTGVGGEVRGNYAVLNAAQPTGATYSDGNLFCSGAVQCGGVSSVAMASGKWYAEVVYATGSNANIVGIMNASVADIPNQDPSRASTGGVGYYALNGNKYIETTASAYGATYTTGDVISIAVDMDNNTVTFYKNGVSQGAISTTINNTPKVFTSGNRSPASHSETWNFGQRPFVYTAPSGYKSLCTQNISVPTVLNGASYMAASIWNGSGGSQTVANTVNGISFQPDMVWIKSRSTATDHQVFDVVRGGNPPKRVLPDSTVAESSTATGYVGTTSTGISLDSSGGGGGDTNVSGRTYVGWQWIGGGAGVSNTNGSVTSTVSANTAAGFSIATFTPPASGVFTFGHGLGIAPNMVIFKDRNTSGNWAVYHSSIGNTAAVFLNTTGAISTSSGYFNNTSPTSTVATGSVGGVCTGSSATVAYSFAAISGYSAFGSYTGNGSTDGPFVYCGFRPRFALWKRSDSTGSWYIQDTTRNPYNQQTLSLYPNLIDAETSGDDVDFLSNGFKIRDTFVYMNASGGTYIWAAFAENPFTIARAR